MAKGRTFYTQIGITKKDLNEMSGCMAAMIFIPIYLIVDGIKIICSIIVGISNAIMKINRKTKYKKFNNRNITNNEIVKVYNAENIVDKKYKIIEYKKTSKNGYYAHIRLFFDKNKYYDYKIETLCSYETPSIITDALKLKLYDDALCNYQRSLFSKSKDTNQ